MWERIDPEIIQASKPIAEAGKYDDAIFAAFRLVEAKIQERIQSSNIGEALIAEAFDGQPPRIYISVDQRDQVGIRQMFSGAMANIRNDRGHKKAPLIPCTNAGDCLLYLSLATFLLYLLNQDKNVFPRIESVKVFGSASDPRVELRGLNFAGQEVNVTGGDSSLSIVRKEPAALEVLLAPHFFGELRVVVDGRLSTPAFCDVSSLSNEVPLPLEIVAADVALYSDAEARNRRTDVVGLLLQSGHSPRTFTRIVPARPNRFMAGKYVTDGPFSRESVGETWYIDPVTRRIQYAWTGAAIANPTITGPVGTFRLGGISILPPSIHTQLGENRYLKVLGSGRDGPVQRQLDVTEKVRWKTLDPSIAFVRRGTVIPKKLGRVCVECELENFVSAAEISVEHLVRGQRTVFFQGLSDIQQIRFDAQDNLYLCNAGPSVFRLTKSGEFAEVFRISQNPLAAAGIDCLAIDRAQNLYINDVSKQAAFRCSWDGTRFVNPGEIAKTVNGAKKGIAVTSQGDVFLAAVGRPGTGWIVKIGADGEEKSIPVSGAPFWMATGPDDNLYVPLTASPFLLIFNSRLELIDRIDGIALDMVHDICVGNDGSIFLPGYHSGVVSKITRHKRGWQFESLVDKFPTPAGITMDSSGRLFVASTVSGSIDVVY